MVTNGEHNSLRMRGNTRPLHVLQVRAEARRTVTALNTRTLLAMLTPRGMYILEMHSRLSKYHPTVNSDGSVVAEKPDNAVSEATLLTILQ